MEKRLNHIAVVLDDKGECVSIAKCVVIDDTKLSELRNQVLEHRQAEQKKREELEKRLDALEKSNKQLEKEIKLLKGEDYEESD